jgi:THUMP domain-like
VKILKKELSARRIGSLEIKKRGVDIDPARFRTRLGLKGDAAGTLILTRGEGRRIALLAERV